MASEKSWNKIFSDYKILKHDFAKAPFPLSAEQVKKACQRFRRTSEKEPRLLCKQDSRESRPNIFKKNRLFLLPVENGHYNIIKGEGYVDIPPVEQTTAIYPSKLAFSLDTVKVGNSEMQHLDYAYATSLIRTFMKDDSLVITIRGRKYTPEFEFRVGRQKIKVSSVQTEVDAGYEGEKQVVLVEAKDSKATNVIIRQLYYPFRQWQKHTDKKVISLFFNKTKTHGEKLYSIWQFEFANENDYNSIKLVKSGKYVIKETHHHV